MAAEHSSIGPVPAVLRCSARAVTTTATVLAALGLALSAPKSQGTYPISAPVLVVIVIALGAAAWFGSRLRYGAVMLACAVIGLIPWSDTWWKSEHATMGGYGLGLATVGVLLTSFISANSKPALRQAWEQCAPASAAAAGWLFALTLPLALLIDRARWFGPLPSLAGAIAFLALSVAAARAAKQRGAAPSAYMAGRSFTRILTLKFLGGAAYVAIALGIAVIALVIVWLFGGGDGLNHRPNEVFRDGVYREQRKAK